MSNPLGSLQARLSKDDPRLYSANRDVAHNLSPVVMRVADILEDGLWPELSKLLEREGVTQDELGDACRAYIEFVTSSLDDPKANMKTVMERSGWLDLAPVVQVAYLATLGSVVAGMQFSGIREATLDGEGPLMTCYELVDRGEQCARFMSMPRWKRWLVRRWDAFKRAAEVLRGRDS